MGSLLNFIRRVLGTGPEQNKSRRGSKPRRSNTARSQATTQRSSASTSRAYTKPSSAPAEQANASVDPGAKTIISKRSPATNETAESPQGDADQYLERIERKINRLAEEFAQGTVNREQFQQLFEHYQRERTAIQNWKDSAEAAGDWKDLSNEGKSIVIRSKHTAKVLGYAIYANESGMPLTTIGDFDIDPDLAVPMLSSYRSATKEIFGGEMRSTEIEGGKWLCFVPGSTTTMLALFTREPAARQFKIMEDLHRLFEKANRRHLASAPIDPQALAFPHASYLGRLQ